jgi:hypothetical protein
LHPQLQQSQLPPAEPAPRAPNPTALPAKPQSKKRRTSGIGGADSLAEGEALAKKDRPTAKPRAGKQPAAAASRLSANAQELSATAGTSLPPTANPPKPPASGKGKKPTKKGAAPALPTASATAVHTPPGGPVKRPPGSSADRSKPAGPKRVASAVKDKAIGEPLAKKGKPRPPGKQPRPTRPTAADQLGGATAPSAAKLVRNALKRARDGLAAFRATTKPVLSVEAYANPEYLRKGAATVMRTRYLALALRFLPCVSQTSHCSCGAYRCLTPLRSIAMIQVGRRASEGRSRSRAWGIGTLPFPGRRHREVSPGFDLLVALSLVQMSWPHGPAPSAGL